MVFLFGITASTFAWFKINSNASVSGFEFTVQGGEGYQISIDDEHYSSSLTSRQMKLAILKGYKSNYIIKDDNIYDNPSYSVDGEILSYGDPLSDAQINSKFNEILLRPLSPTEENGALVFRNYIKNKILASSGQYIEFDLYFKGLGKTEDNQIYDLYLLGEDYINDLTGESAFKTSIKTKTTGSFADKNVITPRANMTTVSNVDPNLDFGTRPNLVIGPDQTVKTVTVYTANAIRFSIGNDNDENYFTDTEYVRSNQIYEISDDAEYDLGSYATDYDKYCNDNGITIDPLKHNLYDCNSNAQYTYYNNLRATSQTPMSYESMPNTIRHLTTLDENNTVDGEYENTINYFTSVKSGAKSHKLTFRFWLEGYDADCFDEISQSIRVNLSFGSVKRN